eukprot:tig00000492_g1490.t1
MPPHVIPVQRSNRFVFRWRRQYSRDEDGMSDEEPLQQAGESEERLNSRIVAKGQAIYQRQTRLEELEAARKRAAEEEARRQAEAAAAEAARVQEAERVARKAAEEEAVRKEREAREARWREAERRRKAQLELRNEALAIMKDQFPGLPWGERSVDFDVSG